MLNKGVKFTITSYLDIIILVKEAVLSKLKTWANKLNWKVKQAKIKFHKRRRNDYENPSEQC